MRRDDCHVHRLWHFQYRLVGLLPEHFRLVLVHGVDGSGLVAQQKAEGIVPPLAQFVGCSDQRNRSGIEQPVELLFETRIRRLRYRAA